MTTYYTEIPTLEMRVAAARLIVVGVVGKVTGTQTDYYDHDPFVRTTYEVAVREVLKGEQKQKRIRVEVMGGKSGKVERPLAAPLREGAVLLLLLVPQPGSDAFVPYFSSAFPIEGDRQVLLGTGAAATLSSPNAPIKGNRISLEALRRLIKEVTKKAEAEKPEPGLAGREYPPVLEVPVGFGGGGEPAAPERPEDLRARKRAQPRRGRK